MSGLAPVNSTTNVVASQGFQMNPVGMIANQNLQQNTQTQQQQHAAYFNTPAINTLLNPPPTKRSVAEDLLAPNKFSLQSLEENRKLYVGKIPKGVSDDFVERLLRCFGPLVSWKRSTDASGEPKAFGFAEYDSIEAVLGALKILNNLPLGDSRVIVKADEKTMSYLNDWKDLKKMDWISKQEKAGITVDTEDLEQKEAMGEILPYEQELIPNYEEIIDKIDQTIKNKEIIEQVAQQSKVGEQQTSVFKSAHDFDPFSKYKEHEKEQRRERRVKNIEKERENKYKKKVEEWQLREANREKEKEREAEKEKEKMREKQKFIEIDLNYDSAEEKKKRKKNPKDYQRYLEERKRIREKEKEDDEVDRKREAEEMVELDKKRAEERKRQEELRKKDEEKRERLKLKRFMEMQEEIEKQQKEKEMVQQLQQNANKRQKTDEQSAGHTETSLFLQQQRQQQQQQYGQQDQGKQSNYYQKQMDNYSNRLTQFASATNEDAKLEYEQYNVKKHKPLTKLNDQTIQNIKNIEQQVKGRGSKWDKEKGDKKPDLNEYQQDEEKKRILEKTKEIYKKLPKDKDDIFKYQLNWNSLFKHDVIEKIGRSWIGKKVKEYMGVEDPSIVSLVVKMLNASPSIQVLREKLKPLFDEKADECAMKLWQTFIFENMKIDEGLYASSGNQ